MKWQPINTAPKDGTEILVAFTAFVEWNVCIARYIRTNEWIPKDSQTKDGWWGLNSIPALFLLEGSRKPRFWCPMPEPNLPKMTYKKLKLQEDNIKRMSAIIKMTSEIKQSDSQDFQKGK